VAALAAVAAAAGALILLRGREDPTAFVSRVARTAAVSPIAAPGDASKTGVARPAESLAPTASAPTGGQRDSPSKESPVSFTPPPETESPRAGVAQALRRLDPSLKPEHRLSKEDFESVLAATRAFLRSHPERIEARYLEIYAGGGLEYVARNDEAASQALAYGDARGEAEGLLGAACSSRRNDVRALLGRAYLRRVQGRTSEFLADLRRAVDANPAPAVRQGVLETLRTACRRGIPEACAEAGRLQTSAASRRRHAPGAW
jgi:hypothetical protein